MISAALLLGLAASAGPPATLAILPAVVEGPHGRASPGQVFEASARGVGVRLDLEALDYEVLFLQGATSRVTRAAECGSDSACVAAVLADAGATLGLRTIVNFAIEPPLVTVSWVGLHDEAARTPEIRQVEGGDWARAVAEAVDAVLLARGFEAGGRLVVRTEPPDLTVELLAPERGRRGADGAFRLLPGRHLVRATDAAGRAVEGEAVITAKTSAELVLTLPAAGEAPPEGGSILSKWWFWTGVGVLAAGAATAAVVATNPLGGDSGPGCVCITTPGGPCGSCP